MNEVLKLFLAETEANSEDEDFFGFNENEEREIDIFIETRIKSLTEAMEKLKSDELSFKELDNMEPTGKWTIYSKRYSLFLFLVKSDVIYGGRCLLFSKAIYLIHFVTILSKMTCISMELFLELLYLSV